MRSTLIELGPWPAWVTVVAALLGAAVVLYVDLRDRRAMGKDEPASVGRTIVVALIGAGLGLGVCFAVNHWGPVKIRSWGTMLMIGFGAGWAWAVHLARAEDGIGLDNLTDITIAILIGALIGARLVAASLNWPEFSQHPAELLRIWEGGLSFHGGLIGGWLGGTALAVRRGLGYARIVDFIPSVALGYAITRIGCFLNGCCYGIPTSGSATASSSATTANAPARRSTIRTRRSSRYPSFRNA
jgi:prolipoprotein diacylglyceryl transferase